MVRQQLVGEPRQERMVQGQSSATQRASAGTANNAEVARIERALAAAGVF